MSEYSREPCPYRIVDDCGGAFAMGGAGGGLFAAIRGFRNAPSGMKRRLRSSLMAAKQGAPKAAGNFATWGVIFSTFDCTLTHLRGKDDPWNAIISGAATGGVLSSRRGLAAMASSAIMGGVFLSLLEGVGIVFTRITAEQFENISPQMENSTVYAMDKPADGTYQPN